ncbi:MAG: hypothetical protein ACLU38_09410 [Dysosmobacter sp.]
MAPVMRAADLVICRAGASDRQRADGAGVPAIVGALHPMRPITIRRKTPALETHGGVEVLLEQDSSGQALFQTAAGILHDDVRRKPWRRPWRVGHPGCGPAIHETVQELL